MCAALVVYEGLDNQLGAAQTVNPYGPAISVPVTQPAYSKIGPVGLSASCGTSNYNACPANSVVGIVASGTSSISVQVSGTFSATAQIEAALDCINFSPLSLTPQTGGAATSTLTAAGIVSGSLTAPVCVQVRLTAFTSGTASVTISIASAGGGGGSGTLSGSVAQGNAVSTTSFAQAWPMMFSPGGIPFTASFNPNIAATTCTSVVASPLSWGVAITNASSAAQTVTLSLYNEGASPTCAAADLRYAIILGPSQTIVVPLPIAAWSAGLAYIFSGAPAARVSISSL